MLHINGLTYRIGGRLLLEDASVAVPEGHKVGIVGRNGVGKSTLFRLILGKSRRNRRTVTLPRNARIGTVAQEAPGGPESLLETVMAGDTELACAHGRGRDRDRPPPHRRDPDAACRHRRAFGRCRAPPPS